MFDDDEPVQFCDLMGEILLILRQAESAEEVLHLLRTLVRECKIWGVTPTCAIEGRGLSSIITVRIDMSCLSNTDEDGQPETLLPLDEFMAMPTHLPGHEPSNPFVARMVEIRRRKEAEAAAQVASPEDEDRSVEAWPDEEAPDEQAPAEPEPENPETDWAVPADILETAVAAPVEPEPAPAEALAAEPEPAPATAPEDGPGDGPEDGPRAMVRSHVAALPPAKGWSPADDLFLALEFQDQQPMSTIADQLGKSAYLIKARWNQICPHEWRRNEELVRELVEALSVRADQLTAA